MCYLIATDNGLVEFMLLLDCYIQLFGGVHVATWLEQGRFDWHKGYLIEVMMMDDFYRGQSMLIDWLHVLHLYIECIPSDGRLEFFSKANDEHVLEGLSLWRFKKGRIPLRP